MIEIKAVIKEFVSLQAQLVLELKRALGARDWQYLTDVPRSGELVVNDIPWRYEAHGTGVRFISTRGTIDMNRRLYGDPRCFDAGRLAEYLSSIGQSRVAWGEKAIDFDHEKGLLILRQIHATGEIRRIDSCDGELYMLQS